MKNILKDTRVPYVKVLVTANKLNCFLYEQERPYTFEISDERCNEKCLTTLLIKRECFAYIFRTRNQHTKKLPWKSI